MRFIMQRSVQVLLIFLMSTLNLFAQSEKIRFNGYGGWAYARTFIDNKYVNLDAVGNRIPVRKCIQMSVYARRRVIECE